MIKTILFDVYGMVIDRQMRFSQRFSRDFNVPMEDIIPFFQKEFQLCLVGKADLKTELSKYLKRWRWEKSVDELTNLWFSEERDVNTKMIESVNELKNAGIQCFINTQNEKYIVNYILKDVGLEKTFDGIFTTNKIGFLKSDQKYWQSICQQLGNPDRNTILCWDDNKEFVKAAKNFGFLAEQYTDFDGYKNRLNKYLDKKIK